MSTCQLHRDNIDSLLATSLATNRNLDKNFRTWLEACHRDLDKTTMYEQLVTPSEQTQLRKKYGVNTTFFHRMSDGSRTIEVRQSFGFV
jgi:hypothetical protein